MIKFSDSKEKDKETIRFLRQMIEQAKSSYVLGLISENEYNAITMRALADLEILEAKYGL